MKMYLAGLMLVCVGFVSGCDSKKTEVIATPDDAEKYATPTEGMEEMKKAQAEAAEKSN